MLPFQGGFDGHKPNLQKKIGSYLLAGNTQGFDISSNSSAGYTSYKKAVDAISNADEFDINLVVTPGVLHSIHSAITTHVIDVCEDRGDCFFVMDNSQISDNIATAVSSLEGLDTNYAATYYPWVKILDFDRNKPIWVPPSVVLPGVIAFNDRVSAEWFAPAGLNRGGLTEVVEVKTRLTHAERDTLYEGRINPIAVFPATGVCVWGQKTLQGRPSALDRINVRRLLIASKKFIASSTRYLVFEQNTSQTRTRFLNIVNPYLESIQQRQGLYAFRVIMDESNNTPDIIDRNILYGQLFLQPAKTAEFIILDFNIQSTGAAFPGA
jgi:phage tail sheath protein FI